MSEFSRFSAVASVLIVMGFSACTAQDFCQKQFSRGSEVQACYAGIEIGQNVMDEKKAAKICAKRYNVASVPVSDDQRYYENTGATADLFTACRAGAIAHIRIAEAAAQQIRDGGCEEVHGPGGITRCY